MLEEVEKVGEGKKVKGKGTKGKKNGEWVGNCLAKENRQGLRR